MSSRSQLPSPPSNVGDKFLEIADVMIIAIDATGKVTYTNATARETLGYESGTLLGADWFDMCIPDRVQDEVRGVFDRLIDGKVDADGCHENAVVTADGDERIVEWHNTVLRDDEGRITGALSSGQDVTGQKEREAELERQELYLESVSDLVTVIEEDGTIRYDSPGVTELLGYNSDERVGESGFAHVHPEDRDQVKERLRTRDSESGTPQSLEYRLKRKDGTWIWVESRARVLTDNPLLEGIVITTQDITERKRAEQTAQDREERLSALVEATTEGVYRISPDWSEIDQLAGQGFVAENRPMGWEEYIPDAEQERVGEAIDEAIETQSPFEMEHQVKRADGTIGWADSGAVPILEDGEIVEWFGTTTDITDRKEREAELERQELYLESVTDAVTVVDEDGTIQYESPSIGEVLGYAPGERVGDSAFDYVHPGDRDLVEQRLQNRGTGSTPEATEFRARAKDGTWTWVEARGKDLTDNQVVDGLVVTIRDITERKQQERKRQQVIDRVTDGIFELDADWQVSFISNQATDLLDTPETELLGRKIWDVFDDARGTIIEDRSHEVMDTREPTSFVAYYSGLDCWFDVQLYPNDDGGIAVYFRDVTDRKEREQARETAEKQYQTLLETAPDPIVAADMETGEIIEVNEAAERFFARPESELIGKGGASLYPTERGDAYESFFAKATEQEGTWQRLPDGSQIYAVTGEGEQIPVKISVRTLELAERDVVFGIFHDISDQLEHERRLKTLNRTTRELFDGETAREVEQAVVKTLEDILDVSTVAFYHFDTEAWELQPVTAADPSTAGNPSDELPILEPGAGVEWRALSTGQTELVDDFHTRETGSAFSRAVRSELAVPVADRGIIVAGASQPEAFTDEEVSLVETLGATAEAALSRAEREQALQDQRRELQQIESINEKIRDISHAIVESETRAELIQTVCECLVKSELVDFAWIGRVRLKDQQLSPQARAGDGEGYLDGLSLGLGEGCESEPSVQAARSRDVRSSSNIATDIHRDNWRSAAVERGFRSVLSIPLISEETLYGILSVYASTQSGFPTALRSVLEELGDLLAHSIVAMEHKQTLYAQQTMELDFAIQGERCLFWRIVSGTELGLELDGFVPQPDQSTLVFARVTDGTPERALQAVEQLDGIERSRLIQRDADTFVQMYVTDPFVGSELSNSGFILRRLAADDTGIQLTVEVPMAADARQAVDLVTSQYEDAQFLAKRESSSAVDASDTMSGSILETLTTRQREVIETAYRCGYFDSPRGASGKDIAEMLGFSNPTFHEHVREAERKLFDTLLQGELNFAAAVKSTDSD